MKNFCSFLCAVLVLIFINSCNSDNDNQGNELSVNNDSYVLNFSIKVSDEEGGNLLSVPGEEVINYGYSRNDIQVGEVSVYGMSNYIISKNCDIIRNNDNEVYLNLEIQGKYVKDDDPVKLFGIIWGRQAFMDYFKYELKQYGNEMKCVKIWYNDELKWDISNSDKPVFSIVKDHNYSNLPPAEPIKLMYPEKVKTDNKFAFNLFKKTISKDLSENKLNTFISPLSVSLALNMLINGAEGDTKNEIKTALEANDFSIEQINEHSKDLSNSLASVDLSTSISLANSIWFKMEFPVKDAFIQTNINYYDAVVQQIDFTSPDAIKTINNWSAEKTKGMIPEAINMLPDNVKLLLINSLFFKSNWQNYYSFDKELTRKEPFYSTDGSSNNVDMMRNTDHYLYKSDSYAGYLKIPVGNNAFSLVIILPDEDSQIQDVVDNIENDPSWTISDNMTYRSVNLSLPKFKMDFSYTMKDYILPQMGMKIPFTNSADFIGISDSLLLVSDVIHKTAIDVNEGGIAAAAVTVIIMADADGGGQDKPIDFKVNKPFIFSICENSTGMILFIGKIEKF